MTVTVKNWKMNFIILIFCTVFPLLFPENILVSIYKIHTKKNKINNLSQITLMCHKYSFLEYVSRG